MKELLYYSLSTVASYVVDNVSHNLFRSDRVLLFSHTLFPALQQAQLTTKKDVVVDGADLVFPKRIEWNGYKARQTPLLYVLEGLSNVQQYFYHCHLIDQLKRLINILSVEKISFSQLFSSQNPRSLISLELDGYHVFPPEWFTRAHCLVLRNSHDRSRLSI